jgi:GNAT superfamily N-acetyltransferase
VSSFTIRSVDANSETDLRGLCEVLLDCVTGGASISFMWPMTQQKAEIFWRNAMEGVRRSDRIVLVGEDDQGILGTVTVLMNQPENQPHRGDIAKMLVHRRARCKGVGAALLAAAEKAASGAGKTLLVLDTVTGGDAERLYSRAQWERCGVIPDYALWPDGRRCATTVFYKFISGVTKTAS